MKAIEGHFPYEYLSEIAEIESWRKELYRPIYHMHKWWARRLGSVFRAVILGALVDEKANVMDMFYQPLNFNGKVVFDPFMGSGTTIGEAHKLGCTVIGRDINPIAYRLTKIALSKVSRQNLLKQFNNLREQVETDLLSLYKSRDSQGQLCDVLYYFWVKILPCPACYNPVDLFSTYSKLFLQQTNYNFSRASAITLFLAKEASLYLSSPTMAIMAALSVQYSNLGT